MKKWTFVALLVLGATVLGATVLRAPMADAAQSVSATIIGPLDANGNVKVHEQGTAAVSVVNASIPVQQAGDPIVIPLNTTVDKTYTVPAGKRLVVQYVQGVVLPGSGSTPA